MDALQYDFFKSMNYARLLVTHVPCTQSYSVSLQLNLVIRLIYIDWE